LINYKICTITTNYHPPLLWSLHDSIHEYKQLVRSPSWDNGYDGSADEEEGYSRVGGGAHAPLASVSEPLSGSNSSLEFGDV